MNAICAIETNKTAEVIIRQLILESENPRQVAVGIHNAFVHGEILGKIGLDFSEQQLAKLFKHLDGIIAILKEIQE